MRYYPKDKWDFESLPMLKAEDWQLDLLKLNPAYNSWGNFEDYMSDKNSGWTAAHTDATWKDHNWQLDDLNELVNFYFEVYRKSHHCPHCDGQGVNPETKRIYDDWYDFDHTGRRWDDKLTEVEVEALVKGGRLNDLIPGGMTFYSEEKGIWQTWKREAGKKPRKVRCKAPVMPTPEAVNAWSRKRPGLGHDAINRSIACRTRAEHLGVYGVCEHCEGEGRIYDEPKATVALQLWYLHPRKGCSRGVYIENIEQEDLPSVFKHLQTAAKRNAQRFSKVKKIKSLVV